MPRTANVSFAESAIERCLREPRTEKQLYLTVLFPYGELMRINSIVIEPMDDHLVEGIETVVLTPHVAYNTTDAAHALLDIAITNLTDFFAGKPSNAVTAGG